MKLLAAGLDMDGISLPANFIHQNVNYDNEALRNIEVFNQENRTREEGSR